MSASVVTRLASAQDAGRAIALVETLVGPFKPEEMAVARKTFETLCDGVRGEIRLAFAANDAQEHSLLGVCTMSFPMALRFSTPGTPRSEYAVLEEMVVGKEGRGIGTGGKLLQVAIHLRPFVLLCCSCCPGRNCQRETAWVCRDGPFRREWARIAAVL